MDLSILTILWYFSLLYLVIHILCFIFADGDFELLLASFKGRRPETILKGQVVWVTGASSGIGEELAYQLAKCGSRLILSARREDELTRVKRLCVESSNLKDEDIFVLPLDLLQRETHAEKTKAAIQHFGRVDILINNSGRSQRSLFMDTSIDVYQGLMELNVLGTISITKQVLPHMTERGSGGIVTVSSIAGLIGVPLSTGYAASKHALQGFFKSLQFELSEYPNIFISTVCPGPVMSQIVQNAFTVDLNKPVSSPGDQKHKMPTSRCVRLMLVGIANNVKEMWIAQQPFPLMFYLRQYTPTFAMFITQKMGKIRVENFKAGLDADTAYFTKPKTA
ncbi:dehydrogenase/reductase SDR family member 7 [Cynoglossus semilaevis]|uniref:Dehydrogenase/reductase (SDR family) member 7 n=1 Tax=Cynoglossus semilaevis TaxID=244447 RepID=A0A3P8UIM0_CYNSE|nr:dehydrogenase/reductase SDR family member 7 [Cynoglossus semilaevis]XP_016887610.1 dehydrogenase/reductase SDR family member 7 [Cynoglossus semilaevis]XP_016887613.1 dehydrogenase/reductase SDR family member 7 [Cynoglossus semilaevis]XP_024915962.1 dehydrogenase/reductase SDR family member 7 [Cynoglossus semilaevis]XP_024915973.1 dehydrogenase/reductase SDR family member 7 [Cynoglossus semilaevis]